MATDVEMPENDARGNYRQDVGDTLKVMAQLEAAGIDPEQIDAETLEQLQSDPALLEQYIAENGQTDKAAAPAAPGVPEPAQ